MTYTKLISGNSEIEINSFNNNGDMKIQIVNITHFSKRIESIYLNKEQVEKLVDVLNNYLKEIK